MQPFRRAVLRGLGIVLPPLLTIVILLWIASSVQQYVLNPVESIARNAIVWAIDDTTTDSQEILQQLQRQGVEQPQTGDTAVLKGETYVALRKGQWVPRGVYETVTEHVQETGDTVPATGRAYYHRYVSTQILKKSVVIPVFLAGFILCLYLLGKFLAAGVGRILWNYLEHMITGLPIIRTVYSSVKQVTDFFFGESEIEFTRVVAVEYPRRGLWSLGFVTGDSLGSLRDAAGESVISLLIPTSPVPGTGFTITVRKSETIDLDIPIEQALQFVISCGVVVPDIEVQREINAQIARASTTRTGILTEHPHLHDPPTATTE